MLSDINSLKSQNYKDIHGVLWLSMTTLMPLGYWLYWIRQNLDAKITW
jgi:hypothetical protein